jgi:2-amino-4-hydroxy-6-hydroxymethyldihydropteridine diphosphokinase
MDAPQQNRAYLSLGSNIEPEHHLPLAVTMLGRFGRVAAVSTVWESPPADASDQPNYLNAAVLLETTLTAFKLREQAIAYIEAALGRVRSADKNAPRPIDIDIMLFNAEVLQLGERRIPSPEIIERAFVAVPLAEIAPDYVHPLNGATLAEIAARFSRAGAGLRARADVVLLR